ncbi:MAG: hypothetical protein AAF657_21145 [Acidobacteriota bacterium]
MADSAHERTELHDGRFGENFDDEVSVSGVVWTTVILAVLCVLGMWITWVMRGYYKDRAEATVPPPSPVAEANEVRLPGGPLLQRDPEGELEALRHEMAVRLGGFGWVDETAGLVHIPIDQAMDLLVEQGLNDGMTAGDAEASTVAEEAGE